MTHRVNLADPNYEPTDEDLQRLSREAFSGLSEQEIEMEARLRREVSALRIEALAYAEALRAKYALR